MIPTISKVQVRLSERSYDISIGTDVLSRFGQLLTETEQVTHAIIVTDNNVRDPHAQAIDAAVVQAGIKTDLLEVKPGETSKSVEVATSLWNQLLDLGTDRRSVIVAVGGGVVGDLAGFIAASFARGISLFQVPTTLLAQVDSSVGGKVGINLPGAKNIVGAFWQPRAVLIDTGVLRTLPLREYRAGLAEVVKYGVILDADFFEFLESRIKQLNDRDHETLAEVVARCCQLKAEVVAADERELTGQRAVLNFGHTFCHALETVCGYGELLHGEGVSIGMLCAARLAVATGRIGPEVTSRLDHLLKALQLPRQVPKVDHDDLITAMQHDKKVQHGRLRFVLPTHIGHVELVDNVNTSDVRQALLDSSHGS